MRENNWIISEKNAVQLLLQQPALSFPIEPQNLQTRQTIYFDSFQGYCHTAHIPISDLCCDPVFQDGCTIFSQNPPLFLVLYNEWGISPQRKRFTLAHELGHIFLSHCDDGRYSEALANHFASHLLIPRVALCYLTKRFPTLQVQDFASFFGVSSSAIQAAYSEPSPSPLICEHHELFLRLQPQLEHICSELSEPIVSI